MSEPTLFRLSVPISPNAEEATVEFLERMFQRNACVEIDLETNTTRVTIFLDKPPAPGKLRAVFPRFSVRKLPPENWAESWKRHFKAIEIKSKLLIKPGWNKRNPRRNQAVVVLDPGLSFGTGQHPTTRFCLEQIVAFRRAEREQSFLDVGTGSGILAIAAAKLGYAPVVAFDNDPAAVRIARANAIKNHVRAKMRVAQEDLAHHERSAKYDLICANLLSDLLISQRYRLVKHLRPDGTLVLAGILRLQFGKIRRVYEKLGLKMVANRAENEWRSGAFQAQK